MKNDFMMAINQVCHERQLPIDIVLEAVEVALISAYKRNFSGKNHVTAQIDQKSGQPLIFVEKAVVDTVEDENNEISVADAAKINPDVQVDGLVSIESTPANFGRIAAQTAKQVILQRIREAERDALYATYAERQDEIVNGTVHKIEPHQVTLSLGKVEAYLPRNEQIPTERYSEGQRLRAYVSSVAKASRGPQIIVSRTHRNMLRRLLEVEVPEIYNGTVEIKSIAREAGYRSKVAVAALQEGVDPVGSCVGMRGTRIQNIVNELSGEKIDVVQWNPDLSYFIANSLSPARVMNVMLHDDKGKTAEVVVPDKQLSLAIGKEGQNARLAAKLTNWRIDIKSASEAIQETFNILQNNEAVRDRVIDRMDAFNLAQNVIADKNPVDLTDGELNILSEAIEVVNLAKMSIEREERAEQEALAEARKQRAQATDILAEAEAILSRTPADEEDEAVVDPSEALALDDLVQAAELALDEEGLLDVEEVETEVEASPAPVGEQTPAVETEETAEEAEDVLDLTEDLLAEAEAILSHQEEDDAGETPEPVEAEAEEATEPAPVAETAAALEAKLQESAEEEDDEEEKSEEDIQEKIEALKPRPVPSDVEWYSDEDEEERERAKKDARRKKRRLVYDEELGEVITERRRKRNRRDDWANYDDDY